MLSRLKLLIGDGVTKLKQSKVIIFGVGGVGGYTVEMLARSGVGSITLVDFDVVGISNKNRQIIALDSTIGKNKVDVMSERVKDINPECQVKVFNQKLTKDNISDFDLEDYDYIIDAIDMVTSKLALIEYAYNHNIAIISAMGAGNRFGIPDVKIDDIYNTSNDGLAKVMRRGLRKRGVRNHTVAYATNKSTPCGETIGSISYFPAMVGCMMSAYVINRLVGENNGSKDNQR